MRDVSSPTRLNSQRQKAQIEVHAMEAMPQGGRVLRNDHCRPSHLCTARVHYLTIRLARRIVQSSDGKLGRSGKAAFAPDRRQLARQITPSRIRIASSTDPATLAYRSAS